MLGQTIHVSDLDFENIVIKATRPVLVDFWAEWCPPCHMIAPHIERLAAEHQSDLLVVKVDIDKSPFTAEQYSILSIPTLVVFIDGIPVEGTVGAVQYEPLNAWVTGLVKKSHAPG